MKIINGRNKPKLTRVPQPLSPARFESLTLSHNNMIALKPVLQAWLEEAEAQAKNKRRDPDAPSVLPMGEVDDVRMRPSLDWSLGPILQEM